MADPILAAVGLQKHFGGVHATDNLHLDVAEHEIHAVIGPNGAGKTTLISQLSGAIEPDLGTIRFKGRDITRWPAPRRARLGLARSFQITSVFRDFTALDNTALAVQAHDGHSFRFWGAAAHDRGLRDQAMAALDRVGLAERADVIAANLAHGEQRQLEIAMALATDPELLLLDEPMAGMGRQESKVMIDKLKSLKGEKTMLLIEHDMDAVFALADRISVLVYGQVIATGPPDEIRANEAVQNAYLGHD